MLAGHYSTALLAHQGRPKGTLLYFLVASQLQDLLWFTLHFLGLEPTGPGDVLDASLRNMTVDMLYSHDLMPQLFWLAATFVVGRLAFKSTKVGLIGAALVAGHFILDLLSGHPHHIFGAESQDISLGLYATNVYLAIAIEVVFCGVALAYFFARDSQLGVERTFKNKASIVGLFVFGILFMLSIATTSTRELFGVPDFDLGFDSNIPTLVLTYVAMMLYLNSVVGKFSKN